jgi:hypothetical protein
LKVSGFTFLRNGEMLGYPFRESILSVLPIVDEFVVALGPCEDDTPKILEKMQKEHKKIKIINTVWNEKIKANSNMINGFVYGQQKSIALFNCTGDWAFYLEGDEVVHEDDLEKIKNAMEKYKDDDDVEALVFDYIHFYGNKNTYAWGHGWYRTEVRIVKNTIPVWAPKGLFFVVQTHNKKGRYPKAAHTHATIYHYGWVRSEKQMNEKLQKTKNAWGKQGKTSKIKTVKYGNIDPYLLREFKGTHPLVIKEWLDDEEGLFLANSNYRLTNKEKKRHIISKIENLFNIDLNKKHFKLVK